jgi:hypothetical protein
LTAHIDFCGRALRELLFSMLRLSPAAPAASTPSMRQRLQQYTPHPHGRQILLKKHSRTSTMVLAALDSTCYLIATTAAIAHVPDIAVSTAANMPVMHHQKHTAAHGLLPCFSQRQASSLLLC